MDLNVRITTAFGINSSMSVPCEEKKLPCFNAVVHKYFKIFYDKQDAGSVFFTAWYQNLFYCDMYNCDDRLFGKLSWL